MLNKFKCWKPTFKYPLGVINPSNFGKKCRPILKPKFAHNYVKSSAIL